MKLRSWTQVFTITEIVSGVLVQKPHVCSDVYQVSQSVLHILLLHTQRIRVWFGVSSQGVKGQAVVFKRAFFRASLTAYVMQLHSGRPW